jgi:hypothetical protein
MLLQRATLGSVLSLAPSLALSAASLLQHSSFSGSFVPKKRDGCARM